LIRAPCCLPMVFPWIIYRNALTKWYSCIDVTFWSWNEAKLSKEVFRWILDYLRNSTLIFTLILILISVLLIATFLEISILWEIIRGDCRLMHGNHITKSSMSSHGLRNNSQEAEANWVWTHQLSLSTSCSSIASFISSIAVSSDNARNRYLIANQCSTNVDASGRFWRIKAIMSRSRKR
jgi:hypothetical protein